VHTGVSLIRLPDAQRLHFVETTLVHFSRLTAEDISLYLATEEPYDKAGAYAIQGRAGRFIPRIEGCYYNVVGLPWNIFWRPCGNWAGRRTNQCSASASLGASPGRRFVAKKNGRPHGPPTPNFSNCNGCDYFFSSAGFSLELCAGCAGGCGWFAPLMPSLKPRTPSPSPRINSGILRPPNRMSTTTE